MSEEVHYEGRLVPTGTSVEALGRELKYKEEVDIGGMVYSVEMGYVNPYADIFRSSKNEDGTIDFEVKYYNGGCGFDGAIEYAITRSEVEV